MAKANVFNIVQACTEMLDLVGVDKVQHGKRVAYLALECGKKMNLGPEDLDRLFKAAMLHDCGVSTTEEHRKLVSELDWPGSDEHCRRGENLLKNVAPLQDLASIVRFHHTRWPDLPFRHLSAGDKLLCNTIYLADRIDALLAQYNENNVLFIKDIIRERIFNYQDTYFNTDIMATFQAVSLNESYWLMLSPIYIDRYISDVCRQAVPVELGHGDLLQIAELVARIVDAKSSYTAHHSYGVSALSRFLAMELRLDKDTCDLIEITGLLHDLGKLNIPDEILEKTTPLTAAERFLIMKHSFDSFQILRRMDGFETVAEWAAFHHERLDGNGYPFRLSGGKISLEARIVAAADVFQAFAQKRPYRDSLAPHEIMARLHNFVAHHRLDKNIVQCIEENLDTCWHIATNP